jgi:hypothetical protein
MPVMGRYESFFTASAGASAAILGLLVVAVSQLGIGVLVVFYASALGRRGRSGITRR